MRQSAHDMAGRQEPKIFMHMRLFFVKRIKLLFIFCACTGDVMPAKVDTDEKWTVYMSERTRACRGAANYLRRKWINKSHFRFYVLLFSMSEHIFHFPAVFSLCAVFPAPALVGRNMSVWLTSLQSIQNMVHRSV